MSEPQVPLFREEVLAARRVRLEGEVLLSRPLRAHVVIGLLTCSIVALGIWVATGQYSRTEIARGVLVTDAETAKIVALHPGIVTRIAVAEGQVVHQGQVLAMVQVDQQYAEGGRATQEGLSAVNAQQRLSVRQEEAARTRGRSERVGLTATIASSREQYANVQGQIAIQRAVLKSLNDSYERYKPIAAKGFISQTQMDLREQQILGARQQLAQLQQQLITDNANASEATAQLDKSKAEEDAQASSARSSTEGLRAQQSQLKAQQSYVLTSPINGVVTALQSGVGRTVDASVPMMSIVPSSAVVHAELYAPSRAIGFVRPGGEVRLLYDAFPYQRFGSFKGNVRSISRVALDPRQLDTPFKIDEPVYRVRVAPDRQQVGVYGEQVKLQPGMTLSANIILERQSFLQWVLEPLNAVINRDR